MKSKFDIMKSAYNGTLTKEDRDFYINNYMSLGEKQIGKPFWEMTDSENREYEVFEYNNSIGNLQGYNCEICKNKGLNSFIKQDYIFYRNCDCINIRNNIERLKNCGLGNLLNIYTFNSYNTNFEWQKVIKQKALSFLNSKDNCFCLLGQSGSGKSHICTALSKELLYKGYDLKYMVWVNDALKLKQIKMKDDVYAREMKKYKDAEVLYIDDFFKGSETPTSADISIAFEIINYRYNKTRAEKKRLITIISSEKTIEDLIQIDEALAGRLKELAKDNLICITGKEKNYRFS